jgi:hypothetical protein
MSVFQKFSGLTSDERELVVFDEAFWEIQSQLRRTERRPEALEAIKDLLNSKTFKNSSSQISEFDLAQVLLLVVNRLEAKED